jgi:hypothetical protein
MLNVSFSIVMTDGGYTYSGSNVSSNNGADHETDEEGIASIAVRRCPTAENSEGGLTNRYRHIYPSDEERTYLRPREEACSRWLLYQSR